MGWFYVRLKKEKLIRSLGTYYNLILYFFFYSLFMHRIESIDVTRTTMRFIDSILFKLFSYSPYKYFARLLNNVFSKTSELRQDDG